MIKPYLLEYSDFAVGMFCYLTQNHNGFIMVSYWFMDWAHANKYHIEKHSG